MPSKFVFSHGLGRLRPVLVVDDSNSVVGILALRYVLYDILDDMERNVGDLIGYIMTDGPGG